MSPGALAASQVDADNAPPEGSGRQFGVATCPTCGDRLERVVATHVHCSERCAQVQSLLRQLAELGARIVAAAPSVSRARALRRMRHLVLEAAAGRLAVQPVTTHGDGRVRRWCTACSTELAQRHGRGRPPATCPDERCTAARHRAAKLYVLTAALTEQGRARVAQVALEAAQEIRDGSQLARRRAASIPSRGARHG